MNEQELAKMCNKSTSDCIELAKQLKETQDKIDKAIEYIEKKCLEFNVKYACQGLNNDKVDVLLDILRGNNE